MDTNKRGIENILHSRVALNPLTLLCFSSLHRASLDIDLYLSKEHVSSVGERTRMRSFYITRT